MLEEYYGRLVRPQDQNLRLAIERVIRIFKSRLFQALLGWCFPDGYEGGEDYDDLGDGGDDDNGGGEDCGDDHDHDDLVPTHRP